MFENSNFPNYTGSPALFVSIRENGTKRYGGPFWSKLI